MFSHDLRCGAAHGTISAQTKHKSGDKAIEPGDRHSDRFFGPLG